MITTNVKTIREALRGFNKLKLNKLKIPALRSVRFQSSHQNTVLMATNLDHYLEYDLPVESPASQDLDVLVPVDVLVKACRSQSIRTHLEIQINPQTSLGEIVIDDGAVRTPLTFEPLPLVDYPETNRLGNRSCTLDAGAVRAIQEALAYASSDPNRYVLNSVMVDSRNVVATNGRRLYLSNSMDLPISSQVLLPSVDLINLFDPSQPAELLMQSDDTVVSKFYGLRQSRWRWVFREIAGRFPDYTQVIPKHGEEECRITLSTSDQHTIRKATCLSEKGKDSIAGLCVQDGQLYLLTGEEKNPTAYRLKPERHEAGEDRHVFFKLPFLLDVIEQGFSEIVIRRDLDPVVAYDDHRTVVFMPMRGNFSLDNWNLKAAIQASSTGKDDGLRADAGKDVGLRAGKVTETAGAAEAAEAEKVAEAAGKPVKPAERPVKAVASVETPESGPSSASSRTPETASHEDALENVVEICLQTRKVLRDLAGGLDEATKVAKQALRERNAIQVRFDRLTRNIESLKQISA